MTAKMNLFVMGANPAFEGRLKEFLEDNYVSIGYPGIGDLEGADRDEIADRLARRGGYSGSELAVGAREVHLFANEMRDGDYLLFADGDTAVLGDVGDYFYVESSDNPEDGACHRRGVTWLQRIGRSELNEFVQNLLDAPGWIKLFPYPLPMAQLDRWISPHRGETASTDRPPVDKETIEEALAVLKQALRSDDPDRRERAAAAILRYAK